MINASCLIFDLDGTISDPQIGITKSINHALVAFGYAPQNETKLTRYIGPPLDESFQDITQSNDKAHITALVEKYRERYKEIGYAENTLYDGISQACAYFKQKKIPMGICTSKPERFAKPILDMFGLIDYFDFISGGEIGVQKVEQLRKLRQDSLIDQNAVMIGDRAVDILSAKANDLRSVGVLWGHGSVEELNEAQPDLILKAPRELETLA